MPLSSFYNPSVITDPYGTPRENGHHTGIDYAYPEGTPIPAIAPGKVVANGYDSRYGNYLDIGNGDSTVRYAHMVAKSPIPIGSPVKAGDTVGNIGQTGYATGPHLHLELRKGGAILDPTNTVTQLANMPDWALDSLNNEGGIIDNITSIPGDIWNTATGAVNVFGDVAKVSVKLLTWLTSSKSWWTIAFIGGGLMMISGGMILYFKDEAQAVAMLAATKGMSKGPVK